MTGGMSAFDANSSNPHPEGSTADLDLVVRFKADLADSDLVARFKAQLAAPAYLDEFEWDVRDTPETARAPRLASRPRCVGTTRERRPRRRSSRASRRRASASRAGPDGEPGEPANGWLHPHLATTRPLAATERSGR